MKEYKKNNLYIKNIKILQNKNIRIENIPENIPKAQMAKNGMPFLTYKGLRIHSSYNPQREAENFIKIDKEKIYSFIFVFGLGYGYHIKEIIKQLANTPCYIVIFEKDMNIFYSALLYSDLSFLEDKRTLIYTEENKWEDFISSLNKKQISSLNSIKLIYLENEYKLFKKEFDALLKQINSILKQKIQNSLTKIEFNTLWLKNTIENTIAIQKHQDISSLFGKFENLPALIISAGPSLACSIKTIKKYQSHFISIASDTALSTLSEANILPDFVVSLDSQIYNYNDFINTKQNTKINLIYALSSNNSIPKWNKKGKNFYFSSFTENAENTETQKDETFTAWLEENLKCKITNINTGASVASAAIEIARLLKLKPIILVGQDLSYQFNITHSVDSPIYKQFLLKETNRINTIESLFHKTIDKRKPIKIENIKTDFVLNNLREWLSQYAEIYQENYNNIPLIINSSKYGLDIKNIPKLTIKQIIKKANLRSLNKKHIKNNAINKAKLKKINKKDFLYIIKDLSYALNRLENLIKKEKEQKNIQSNILTIAKKHIEEEFNFTKEIFIKANIYYSSDKSFNPLIYTELMLSSMKPITKKISKLIKLINK